MEQKTKYCSRCDRDLPLFLFGIDKNKKDGLSRLCKQCQREDYKKNREKKINIQKKYASNNKEQISEYQKEYRVKNKENISKNQKEYWAQYSINNKEKIQEYQDQYYQNNKDIIKQKIKNYEQSEKGKIVRRKVVQKRIKSGKIAEYQREKRKVDLNYKLGGVLRSQLNHCLKNKNIIKSQRMLNLLACDLDFLKQYLESQFKEGMSWENYGKNGWELDHKIPCASFDLSDPEQQKICFHYSNYQPLWQRDNSSKNSFYNGKKHYYEKSK